MTREPTMLLPPEEAAGQRTQSDAATLQPYQIQPTVPIGSPIALALQPPGYGR